MPKINFTLLLICLVVAVESFAISEPVSFTPEIAVGYRPDPSTDEGGFWYQIDKLEEDIKRSPYIIRDTPFNAYVEDMVCQLAGEHCSEIRVYIVNNPHFNASMYPNGMMHVYTGLLLRTADETQLATVLSHEIAHYLRGHQIKQWRQLRGNTSFATFLDLGIAAVTGVYGLASMMAISNSLAFSREHETEADMYGLQLLVASGYEPSAAAELWEYVEFERDADQSKKERNPFYSTHPKNEDRMNNLSRAAEFYLDQQTEGFTRRQDNYLERLVPLYQALMKEQTAMQEYGQTQALLDRHDELGYPSGMVNFFRGELYRQRKGEGDLDLAIISYEKALDDPRVPDQAYRELGYLLLKQKRDAEALNYFKQYLQVNPMADDSQMINFYVQSLENKKP